MKILLIGLFLYSSIVLNAQQDTKAKQILDKVAANTHSYKTIKATFTFILENKEANINDKSEGTILLKGEKYKIEIMGTEIYSDGKSVWSYLSDVNEVNITEPYEDDDNMLSPSKIFTIYEENFKRKYINEKGEGTKRVYEIDLFPAKRDKTYAKIKLKINKNNYQISSIKQFGKDGINYTVKLNTFTVNSPIPDDDFVFNTNAYKDIEVIDMR